MSCVTNFQFFIPDSHIFVNPNIQDYNTNTFLAMLQKITYFPKKNITIIRIVAILLLATSIILICLLILRVYFFIPLIKIVPELLGMNGKKTYLLLFQNNTELRPGGGFIGAYGLVSFDKAKMGQITIHNTYDADGQLKKHIEP